MTATAPKTARGGLLTSVERRDRLYLGVAVETAVMAVAVFWQLGSKSLFVDEGFSVAMARVPWPKFWHIVTTREANQSLYYLMLRGLVHAGSTERWLRLVPALAVVATVPTLVVVARRLFTDRVGLLTGFLLCFNGFFVSFGQFSRAYSLVLLLVTASSLLFLRALEEPTSTRWLAWAGVSGLACYAHFFAVLVIGAQLLSLAFRDRARPPLRSVVSALLALAVLLAPLAVFVAVVPGDQIDFIPAPTVHALFHDLDSLAGHGGPALLLVVGVFGLMSLVVLVQRWRGPNPRSEGWPILFALSWLVVPIIVAFGVSLLKPVVLDSYLLVSLPGLVLLGAVGLDRLSQAKSRVAFAIAITAFIGLGGRSVLQVYGHSKDENWRGATALVMSRSRPNDGLTFVVSDERTTFEYYASRLGYPASAPTPLYPSDAYGQLVPQSVHSPRYSAAALDRLLAGRSRIWVLQRAANGDVGKPRFQLPSDRYILLERHRFTDLDVTLYQR